MRIVVVNNFYPPRVGGSSHMAESLAHGYAAAGHQVLVVTAEYPGAPDREEADGVTVVRLPAARMPQIGLSVSFDMAFTVRPSLMKSLNRLLDDFSPDAIHQHGQFFDLTWATGQYARSRRVPALLSIHTRLESPGKAYGTVFRGLDAGVVKTALRRYRPWLVVMDQLMAGYIADRYAGAYTGTVAIPVGVDVDWVQGGDATGVRQRHGLGDRPVILSIGHVIPLRDRLMLVEALPAVLAAVPDAVLLVAGGIYYDAFLQRAEALGVAGSVKAVGAVPKSEIPNYLAAAAVESHDLQGYGFGTASLESMAAGVPTVAAVGSDNFPGLELVDGGNVYLVPEGDPAALAARLVAVLNDPKSARDTVGRAGAAFVQEHFTMDRVIAQYLEVLGDLAAGRTPEPFPTGRATPGGSDPLG